MILESENIILRPLKDIDFDKYLTWHSDPEIRFQALMHPHLVSEQIERGWFLEAQSDISNNKTIFSIVHKSDDKLIGYFQLTSINMINRNALLGIVIGDKEYQGKGFGKEILVLGIDYAFNSLGLKKLSLEVNVENKKALKLYQNIGFIKEGKYMEEYYSRGKYYDVARLALIKK